MRPYLTTDHPVRYLLLLVAVLPLFIFRDFTRNNELRYLVIADEALREGHLFAFYNQGEAYADKPPLYLWIIMLGKVLFGKHSMLFLGGLFSMIPGLVVLRVMDRWTGKWFENEARRSATQLMLFTSAFFFLSGAMVRMDMLMCMFIVLALRMFYRIYSGEISCGDLLRERILFAVFVFLGVFSKGPMGILVPLISTITFLVVKREWRRIGYYWGWLTWGILILLCGVWFTGVYIDAGSEYLHDLVVKQTAGRAVDAYHHKQPFWFYGISIWYTLAPWSPLIVGSIVAGCLKRRRIGVSDPERFFLTAGLSTFVTLSLISGKVAIYLLPALPFLVYLAGLWLGRLGVRQWVWRAVKIPAIVSLCVIFAGAFALPKWNVYIGLGDIAAQAKAAGEKLGDSEEVDYYSFGISRGENMEAYIGKDLHVYEWMQELPAIHGPSVLISRDRMVDTTDHRSSRKLLRRLGKRERHAVGPWFYVVIPKEDEL